ncbi:MAG: class I SAM-dependent methyltransferase [Chloroflexi bacterium]|nr:class I SAM-dependent methyltransferase [Chloroflexota bacterium]
MKLVITPNQRTRLIASLMEGWIAPHSRVLDLGAGQGYISRYLASVGHRVTPVDVRDTSIFPEFKPMLYDGAHLPFESGSFDTAILCTVLHHTPSPEVVLREAGRVANQLVVIEDIFRTRFGKFTAAAGCSISNFQFTNHPHSNRSDEQWRETFGTLGMPLLRTRYQRYIFVVLPFFAGAYHISSR